MEFVIERISEEEGRIVFSEDGKEFMSFCFFSLGEDEAEIKIQDIVGRIPCEENKGKRKKIISKVSECIRECFLQLWNDGFEEVLLVFDKKSKYAEILNSTDVVEMVFSEYMMKLETKKGAATSSCDFASGTGHSLRSREDGESVVYENPEENFFCRLLKHQAEEAWYLYEVEVEESVRNRGIATDCLRTLFQMVPGKIYLQVGSYNKPAVHLYEKLGFQVSEELCYYTLCEDLF